MVENALNKKQIQALIIMFIFGTTLVLGVNTRANQDSWIAIAIAVVLILPMVIIYGKILSLYPGKNLFDILIEVFGKLFGKTVCSLYIFYSIHLGSMVLRNCSEFIKIQNMQETPMILTSCFMIMLSIYTASVGIINVGRLSKVTFKIVALFVILITILNIPNMDFTNILPILNTEPKVLMKSSFEIFAFPFGETVLIMALFSEVNKKENPTHIYLKSILISALLLITANLRNLFVLGTKTIDLVYFTSYFSTSVISVGEFFTRFEVIIAINFLTASFVKLSVCVLVSCIGLSKLLNIDNYRVTAVPCGLIVLTMSTKLYSNTAQMFDFIKTYPYYAFPFEVLFPIIIYITAKIKQKKNSTKPAKPQEKAVTNSSAQTQT